MTDNDFFNQIENLNIQQLEIFKMITNQMIGNENSNKIFITGGAGSGKTFLLKLIVQQIIRMNCKVVVASPTGCSAKLINGQTIHSCLMLPTNKNEKLEKLGGLLYEQMKLQWQQINYLIIDEISMISHQQLINIDLRLKELRPQQKNQLFGGINMILFGDLLQLPPIKGTPIYKLPEYLEGHENIFDLFKYFELTSNMRQQGDATFIQLLNNLREGKLTFAQYQMLQEKHWNYQQQLSLPQFSAANCTKIVPTNHLANEHNNFVINEIFANEQKHYIQSMNEVPANTKLTRPLDLLMPTEKNIGLPFELTIFVGMRVSFYLLYFNNNFLIIIIIIH
jgi:RecG-like helicase